MMYNITGRIVDITHIDNKSSYVVIKKTIKGKITLYAGKTYGYWNDQMKLMKLNIKDKIIANMYISSRLFNGKWYHNLDFTKIKRIEEKPKENNKNNNSLFLNNNNNNNVDDDNWHGHIIDENTGEIIL